jgi:hypothetical protein
MVDIFESLGTGLFVRTWANVGRPAWSQIVFAGTTKDDK